MLHFCQTFDGFDSCLAWIDLRFLNGLDRKRAILGRAALSGDRSYFLYLDGITVEFHTFDIESMWHKLTWIQIFGIMTYISWSKGFALNIICYLKHIIRWVLMTTIKAWISLYILNISFQHALWSSALDLIFKGHWLCPVQVRHPLLQISCLSQENLRLQEWEWSTRQLLWA